MMRGIGYREARGHAIVAAIIIWVGAASVSFATAGNHNILGQIKGGDFLHFYTLAHATFNSEYPTPARQADFHELQLKLVPESTADHYVPVYPPTAALLFRPLAAFSFREALLIWSLATASGYFIAVAGAWCSVRRHLPDLRFVLVAAAAFPPFFQLVLHGQSTLLPFLGFFFGWLLLSAGFPTWSGVALGLLAAKPQFGIVIGLALLFGRMWRTLLGMFACVAVLCGGVIWTMGVQALFAYREILQDLPQVQELLEPNPWRMHSMRAITRLIPNPLGDVLLGVLSIIVILVAIRAWRSAAPLGPRFAIVIIATVLVNPHLFAYDAVVLVLPFIWLGGWLEATASPIRQSYWQAVYAASIFLLIPTAGLIHLQASVVVLSWIFWRVALEVIASGDRSVLATGEKRQDVAVIVRPDAS